MLIGLVLAALVVGGLVVSGGRPLSWAKSRWYDLLNRTEIVTGVVATVEPAAATVKGSDPARLTDGDVASWTAGWAPRGKAAECAGPRGTAAVTLNFAPRNVRRVNVWAGLPKDDQDRLRQARPHWVILDLGEGRCVRRELIDTPDLQTVELPSGPLVSKIRVWVADAYATKGGRPALTITELQLLARPV